MKYPWPELKFWETGECQVIEERLADLKKSGVQVNPDKDKQYLALKLVPFDKVKVCILGQDPYPNHADAMGLAFSVPQTRPIPASLKTILKEYQDDLHYATPSSGDLSVWCDRGVLLWNSIPTCEDGKSASHSQWDEYEYLTGEILSSLSDQTSCVFAGIGAVATRLLKKYVKDTDSHAVYTSHPSPRGQLKTSNPFSGCRLFSTINTKLNSVNVGPMDWRLP